MSNTLIEIEDGIHPGVLFEEYLLWDRMSKSTLKFGLADQGGSMLKLKAKVDGEIPDKKTDALDLGTAFDTRLLEPQLFKDTYTVADRCCAIKKSDKQQCKNPGITRHAGKWYCGTKSHAPADISADAVASLSEEMWIKVNGMFGSVIKHEIINTIRQSGGEQVSIAWTDPHTGIKMKGRLDKLAELFNIPLILDVKTTRPMNNEFELGREFERLGYHVQCAIYREGMKILTGKQHDFLFAYVESETPYEVGVFGPCQDTLNLGSKEYHDTLNAWANCLKTGVYPSKWGNDIIQLSAPSHKLRKLESVDTSKMDVA